MNLNVIFPKYSATKKRNILMESLLYILKPLRLYFKVKMASLINSLFFKGEVFRDTEIPAL